MIQTIKLRPVPLLGQRNNYRPMPYRPVVAKRPEMGQAGAIAALGAVPLLIGAAIGGGIAWAGFSLAKNNKGASKVVGYVVGALGSLWALGGLVGAALWTTGVFVADKVVAEGRTLTAESVQKMQQQSQQWSQEQQQKTEEFFRQPPAEPMMEPSFPGTEPFESSFTG